MGRLIAFRPVDFSLETDGAVHEMMACLMAPVFAMAKNLEAQFEADGLPKWRKVNVTVHVSEQLRAALGAADAFDLNVSYDDEESR